ncbi:MAG: hypothetical protein HYZ27_10180, partial [Deltaproteobacteria bacterium]|nr:hypothetical protein [Deltaproteobacteria bacterium]
AYEDVAGGEGSIKMLKREAGQWKRYQLDPEGPAGAHLAVAVDSRGRPLVAYFSQTIRGLKIYDESN